MLLGDHVRVPVEWAVLLWLPTWALLALGDPVVRGAADIPLGGPSPSVLQCWVSGGGCRAQTYVLRASDHIHLPRQGLSCVRAPETPTFRSHQTL